MCHLQSEAKDLHQSMTRKEMSLSLGVQAFNSKATTCVRCNVSRLTRRVERDLPERGVRGGRRVAIQPVHRRVQGVRSLGHIASAAADSIDHQLSKPRHHYTDLSI